MQALLRHRRRPRHRRRDLTPELVERLGKAATLWAGGGRVLVGRDTRGSGPELEEAFARGIVVGGRHRGARRRAADAGGRAARARPRRRHLGVAQPARVQRRQVLRPRRAASSPTTTEEEIEALLDAPRDAGGGADRATSTIAADSYLEHVVERFGTDLDRPADRRSTARTAPTRTSRRGAFERARRRGDARSATSPTATNINVGCGATDLGALQQLVVEAGSRPRGRVRRRRRPHARRRRARRRRRRRPDPRDPRARTSASTSSPSRSMTNLGFHRLMAERGIRVVTTDVGDRYVLEALRARGRPARRRAVRATSSASATTSPATASPPRCSSAARSRGRTLRRGGRRDAALSRR